MSNIYEIDQSEPSPPRRDLPQFARAGDLITDRYQAEELIGRGGFGEVYRATDLLLKRKVAVKILYRKAQTTDDLHEQNQSRFLNEARITAQLKHPALPITYDFGTLPQGELFLVCELLQGMSLTDLIRRGKLEPLEALNMLDQVAGAVQVAHDRGVLHRDLKPSNIFYVEGEREGGHHYKVLDFGIAKQAEQSDLTGINLDETRAGGVIGSVRYLAPERLKPDCEYGPPSDLYSLGVVFFIALTQRLPYRGSSMFDVGLQHITAPIPKLEIPTISLGRLDLLQGLLNDLLAKSDRERIQSATQLRERIEQIRADWDHEDETSAHALGDGVKTTLYSPNQTLSTPTEPLLDANADFYSTANIEPPLVTPKRRSLSPIILGLLGVSLLGSGVWWSLGDPSSTLTDATKSEILDVEMNTTPEDIASSDSQDVRRDSSQEREEAIGSRQQAHHPQPREKPRLESKLQRRSSSKGRTHKKSKRSKRSSPRASKTQAKRNLSTSQTPSAIEPKVSLTLSLSPLKATYLKSDRVNLKVVVNGEVWRGGGQVKCTVKPSMIGQLQGRSLKLKSAGKGSVSCCVRQSCKRKKILVLNDMINEF